MRFTLRLATGATLTVSPPSAIGQPGVARGACPSCGIGPFLVRGQRVRIAADNRAYESEGSCVACGASVGLVRAEPETMFGLLEDSAVLEGRPRVY